MRAARGLLRWSADDLAKASKVSIATIRRAEATDDAPKTTDANLAAIRTALEAAGVEFINDDRGDGVVRLRDKS